LAGYDLCAQEEEAVVNDKLQQVLWCVWQIKNMRRIAKPRHPMGVLVCEIDAIVELKYLLELP
jgi:hypothetical protein